MVPVAKDLIPRRPDLKIDDPVIVWHRGTGECRRYFAGWDEDGEIMTWMDGATKWSSDGGTTTWDNYRLPTPEDK